MSGAVPSAIDALGSAGADPRAPRPPARTAVVVELLDAPCLYRETGERLVLERKAAALLALLALDGAHARAAAAALLWPEAEPAQARNSLRQRLFRLQRTAGSEIVIGSDELMLASGITHDLGGAVERLAEDPDARAGELLGTLDFFDCPALAEWVEAARLRWRQQRASLLAAHASAHESRSELVAALRYAQRLVADEPLLEHAHRRVMRLHYLRGDRGAALAAFERCRAALREGLQAAPDRETTALAALIGADAPASAARPAPPPVTVLRPPRLSGRAAAHACLTTALAARRVLLVAGDPGIGKSRLIHDAVRDRTELLATGARAGDARVAHALLARLTTQGYRRYGGVPESWATHELARLVPEIGPAPGARLDPLRLQQALAVALGAWIAAGLEAVIVDDLHHADAASLECLLGLAASTRSQPLAWVLAVRRNEMPDALTQWLHADDADGVELLTLEGLDAAGVTDLLESLALPHFEPAAWSAKLLQHAGGNPLHTLETLRALLARGGPAPAPDAPLPVPTGLGALIERRLGALSEPALRLARLAALAGAEFDADVAARVLEAHPLDLVEPWRELEQAHLLQEGHLSHDLIAEATLRSLPASIAQSLQARLAASLEALGHGAARVAPHWALAKAWSHAGDAYAQAAREAQRASRRDDEVLLWEQAADCHERAGHAGKSFDARADSIESLLFVRGTSAGHALAQRLTAEQRSEPQRLRALLANANVALMAGDHGAGEAAARAALETATRLGAPWPRFEAARLLAIALAQAQRATEALQVIEPFREIVVAEGSAEQRQHFWSDYAYALKAAQRQRATAEALREAMRCAQQTGDFAELATLTSNLAIVEGNFGHAEQALDHARRARALRDPLGGAGGPASGAIDLYVGVYAGAVGYYDEALADLERAATVFAGNGETVWQALAANHRAHLWLQLGQHGRARQSLRYDPVPMVGMMARRALLEFRLERALGGRGEVGLRHALDLLGPHGDPMLRMLVRLEGSLLEEPTEAARSCEAVQAEAQAQEHIGVAMRARLLRVHHLTRGATLGAAGDELEGLATALATIQPLDTFMPQAWWILVQAYDALRHDDAANAALAQGYDWAVGRALPHVPAPFRDSFLNRNAVNRVLIAAAGRRLGRRVPPVPEPAGMAGIAG